MALKSTFGANQVTVEIEERLDILGKQLDRLKAMYEQYFMGILKVAPAQLHRDVERTIRELTQVQIRNTGLRYRFTTLSQKYGSYNTYWKRILRDIENGRYVRDVRRASRRAMASGMDVPPELLANLPKRLRERIIRDREALARRAEREGKIEADGVETETPDDEPAVVRQPKPPGNVHTISADDMSMLEGDDVDFDSLFGAIMKDDEPKPAAKSAPKPAATAKPAPKPKPAPRPSPPPRPAAARKPSPPPPRAAAGKPPPPGMTERQSRDLYKRYVQARQLVGERTDNLSYDKLMSTLNKQAPKIMQQHRAKGVEFNVVVKGDKVVLKAKPKR